MHRFSQSEMRGIRGFIIMNRAEGPFIRTFTKTMMHRVVMNVLPCVKEISLAGNLFSLKWKKEKFSTPAKHFVESFGISVEEVAEPFDDAFFHFLRREVQEIG